MRARQWIFVITSLCLILSVLSDKKRKRDGNDRENEEITDLHRPFRLAKLNLVWTKAQSRLTEAKLKSLYSELSAYDKEALIFKHNDQLKRKDQEKVDEMRNKLKGILKTYNLLEHFDETEDKEKVKEYRKISKKEKTEQYEAKSLFKYKKLNKLWVKAEDAGLNPEELRNLKEELQQHQERVDEYYGLLNDFGSFKPDKHENAINAEDFDVFNEVASDPNDNNINTREMNLKKYESDVNKLRELHQDIKKHYDRLERRVSSGPHSKDFIEPKVQGLWRVALASNFTDKELNSIRSELLHFEGRLMKLRNLQREHKFMQEKYKDEKYESKGSRFQDMEDLIKKQIRKVEKIQEDLEESIFRHSEL